MIYKAQVTLCSPLALTVRRAAGNELSTLAHVPGTSLRGALAAAYLRSGRPEDPAFRSLFLSGQARFGNLRMDGSDPWPLSARVCREWGGEHPISDRLLPAAAGRPVRMLCNGEMVDPEESCGAKLEQPKDFVRWEQPGKQSQARYVHKKPIRRRTAHAAIDSFFLRTKTGQLFSVESLEAGQVFQGRIVAEGDAAGALEELVKGNRELRMGRARTRGGGLAEMRLIPEAQGPTQTDRARAKQRIESMWRKAQELGGRLSQKHVVTVTLRSPALVWDEYLMTRAWLNAADVGLAPEWKLMGWYSEMTPVTGWHAAAGVPRTELLMVAAGSCFAYASAAPAKADELVEWAVKLEYEGIGDRRDEGFGEAVACHEMHARQAEVQ